MKKILTTLTISGAILSAGFGLATNASAATINDDKQGGTSIAEFTIDAGSLSLEKVSDLHFSKDGKNPTIADFTSDQTLKLDNTPVSSTLGQTSDSDLQAIVSDYRGSHDGWDLAVKMTDFTSTTNTNDKITNSTLNLTAKDSSTGVAVADANASVATNGTDVTLVSAGADTGTFENTFDLSDSTLTIPANKTIQAGTYQSTVTWTLSSTPKAAAAN